MTGCADCGKALSSRNVCGRCRACTGKHMGAKRRIHADKTCRVCGIKVSRFGKNGLCREHFMERLRTPEMAERRREGLRRHAAANKDKMRAVLRENHRRALAEKPGYREQLIRRAKQIQPLGVAAGNTPESIAKRARAVSERRLGWCPPEWRAAHKRLVRNQGIPAARAKRIILEQIGAEKRRKVKPKPPKTFEEKLQAIAEGRATIVEVRPIRRELDYTAGGVSSGWDA